MTGAAAYPLSSAAASGLKVVARESTTRADALGPAIRDAVTARPEDETAASPAAEETSP
jgi:hypothetical protein